MCSLEEDFMMNCPYTGRRKFIISHHSVLSVMLALFTLFIALLGFGMPAWASPPAAVTLTATDITGSDARPRVKLNWPVSTDVDFNQYRIYVSTSTNVTESDTLLWSTSNKQTLEHSYYPSPSVSPGTTYYYRIFVV